MKRRKKQTETRRELGLKRNPELELILQIHGHVVREEQDEVQEEAQEEAKEENLKGIDLKTAIFVSNLATQLTSVLGYFRPEKPVSRKP